MGNRARKKAGMPMVIGLVLIFAVPIVADFLQLVELSPGLQRLVLIVAAVAMGLIEVVSMVHRRVARPKTRTVR